MFVWFFKFMDDEAKCLSQELLKMPEQGSLALTTRIFDMNITMNNQWSVMFINVIFCCFDTEFRILLDTRYIYDI